MYSTSGQLRSLSYLYREKSDHGEDFMKIGKCGRTGSGQDTHVQPMTEDVYSPSVPEMGTWLLRLGRKAGM